MGRSWKVQPAPTGSTNISPTDAPSHRRRWNHFTEWAEIQGQVRCQDTPHENPHHYSREVHPSSPQGQEEDRFKQPTQYL